MRQFVRVFSAFICLFIDFDLSKVSFFKFVIMVGTPSLVLSLLLLYFYGGFCGFVCMCVCVRVHVCVHAHVCVCVFLCMDVFVA